MTPTFPRQAAPKAAAAWLLVAGLPFGQAHGEFAPTKETMRSRADSPTPDCSKLVKITHDGSYRGYLPSETLSMHRKNCNPMVEVAKTLAGLREGIAAISQP